LPVVEFVDAAQTQTHIANIHFTIQQFLRWSFLLVHATAVPINQFAGYPLWILFL